MRKKTDKPPGPTSSSEDRPINSPPQFKVFRQDDEENSLETQEQEPKTGLNIRLNIPEELKPEPAVPEETKKKQKTGVISISELDDESNDQTACQATEGPPVQRLVNEYGPPAFFREKSKRIISINERFWAEVLAAENIIIHEPDEMQFYTYEEATGLHVATTNDAIRNRFADRIFCASQQWQDYEDLGRFTGSRILAGAIAHLRGVTEARPFKQPPCTYIHCQNCVLELTDGGVVQHSFSSRFKSRNRSPIPYVPDARCPRFENEVLCWVKPEDRELIQKMFGSMLLGYNIAQKILLLHGIGDAGKTTLALILQSIVGEENFCELRTAHLDQRFEIGRFLGKSLLVGVDVDTDFLSGPAISRLKGLTGGDLLDAERKGANANYRLRGRFNVLVTSNSRLQLRLQGDQPAWRRRLVMVPYDQTRTTKTIRDFHLLILREEAPGILAWGLEGLAKLRRDLANHGDIQLTSRQHHQIENFLEQSDSLRVFLRRQIIGTKSSSGLSVDEIVSEYLSYCVNLQWVPMATGTVQRHLEPLMLEYFAAAKSGSMQRDNKGVRGFRNVRFRGENETDIEE
jgi:putative DNA primase/helicase